MIRFYKRSSKDHLKSLKSTTHIRNRNTCHSEDNTDIRGKNPNVRIGAQEEETVCFKKKLIQSWQ